MVLKDNMVTTDNLDATAGSSVLLGAKPSTEGTVAQRLRNAGAIILGKSNLSEWSNLRSLNFSTPGWSARGGQCTGAYYPGMDASGSSTGSAVSTALGLTLVALSTEVRHSYNSTQSSWLMGDCRRMEASSFQPTGAT
jgi:amidase